MTMVRLSAALFAVAFISGCNSQRGKESALIAPIQPDSRCELCLDIADGPDIVSFAPGSAKFDDRAIGAITSSLGRGKDAHRISIVAHAEWTGPSQVDSGLAHRRADAIRILL